MTNEGAAQEKPLQEKNTVKEAGEKMRDLETDKFPVAAGDLLVGTVEGKFPDREAARYGHDPSTTLVRESMVHNKLFCYNHQTVEEAIEMMRSNQVQHLAVVDGEMHIVGIVSLEDLKTRAK